MSNKSFSFSTHIKANVHYSVQINKDLTVCFINIYKESLPPLLVLFPYAKVYDEQVEYMCFIFQVLIGHRRDGVVEMPTGTGKTISLFAVILPFLNYSIDKDNINRRLVFCTRTVHEMGKASDELKRLVDIRQTVYSFMKNEKIDIEDMGNQITSTVFTSRKNLCRNEEVIRNSGLYKQNLDGQCRHATISHSCEFYNNLSEYLSQSNKVTGNYNLDDLRFPEENNKLHSLCPYYYARKYLVPNSNVVIMNYQYVIDPKVNVFNSEFFEQKSGKFQQNIVVFDEAHNIDDVAIEALTVAINKKSVLAGQNDIEKIRNKINKMQKDNEDKIVAEYQQILNGLTSIDSELQNHQQSSPLVLPEEIQKMAIPGNIRRAQHFLSLMDKLCLFLRGCLKISSSRTESRSSFLYTLSDNVYSISQMDVNSFTFLHERFTLLLSTIEESFDLFKNLSKIVNFFTLLGGYKEGFVIIIDPFPESDVVYDPTIELSCMDSSIALKRVFVNFDNVILTSGTLSPISIYPQLLRFSDYLKSPIGAKWKPRLTHLESTIHFKQILTNRISPIFISKSSYTTSDDVILFGQSNNAQSITISSKHSLRVDKSVLLSYGEMLLSVCSTVPDGVICFFPSKLYMQNAISNWMANNIFERLRVFKVVYMETEDVFSTTTALSKFRQSVDSGRGGLFLSVARGKVSEGIDFNGPYGVAVVMIGVPFQYTLSKRLIARLEYLKIHFNIDESVFLNFDAMRAVSQCIGRVIRNKEDVAVMVFADYRYSSFSKHGKLPRWILDVIDRTGYFDLNIYQAKDIINDFLLDNYSI